VLVSGPMQIIRSPEQYDVCIVGSGAGGGMAAYMLTAAGANCIMLEAGPIWDTRADGFMFKWSYDSPRRGASTPAQQFGEFDAGLGGWSLEGEPYTVASGESFDWFLGANRLGVALYDESTAGCRDGLGTLEVNRNQGAESVVSFLCALIAMRGLADDGLAWNDVDETRAGSLVGAHE